jgi:hypothetical protein
LKVFKILFGVNGGQNGNILCCNVGIVVQKETKTQDDYLWKIKSKHRDGASFHGMYTPCMSWNLSKKKPFWYKKVAEEEMSVTLLCSGATYHINLRTWTKYMHGTL